MTWPEIQQHRSTVAAQIVELRATMPPLPEARLSLDKRIALDEIGRLLLTQKPPGEEARLLADLSAEEISALVSFVKEFFP